MSVRRAATAGCVALGLALGGSGLAACTGDAQELSGAQTATPAYGALLSRTVQSIDSAKTVRFHASSTDVPAGAGSTKLLTGQGVMTRPTPPSAAFRGTLDLLINDRRTTLKLISYRDVVYVRPAGATKYQVVDPVSFGLFDPAVLIKAKTGISSLVSNLRSVQDQGVDGVDGVRVHTLQGEVSGLLARRILPIADVYRPVGISLRIDEETAQLREIDLTGYFFTREDRSTYRITLSRWNEKAAVTTPAT
ncbi:LppX_LprAFG lipoprotein [Spongisporangium articulatum]|uniref:LppX_LprAFG lipoprotein n=1 Tax=Spongisporangium articulatum TaxID=3362603 RepID=A0ABW8ANT0_9ACTN